MEASLPPTFFDLLGTLVTRRDGAFVAREEALDEMTGGMRLGVLCNLPRGRDARDAQRVMEEAGVYDRFDPDLVVVASLLPRPLPDRRAFGVAAALADAPIAACTFVSSDPAMVAAARAAGMETVTLAPDEGQATLLADTAAPRVVLLSGEVDEDIGPMFVLAGRVVTMAKPGEVLADAQLVVSQGRIAAIVPAGADLPAEYAGAPRVEIDGTIYPGLIDLHNHFVYNVLPLWEVPKRYDNRSQWPRAEGYSGNVTLPVRALGTNPATAKAIVRYVEAKALIGGTTTGQGMRTRVHGGPKLFEGAMRNVEQTGDPRLPEAGTMVPTLYPAPDRIRSFRASLDSRTAYFYHLAEGVDAAARRTFTDLRGNDLVAKSLVGIHCLGLHAADLETLAASGAKGVWSPFSNLLLYGRTLDLGALLASGLTFSIGCDWTPTGSRNLLEELKIARWVVGQQSADLTSEDLVRAVTASAAEVVGWGGQVGSLHDDALADLLVLDGQAGDPYDQLIAATEPQVSLTIVHGLARYGDRDHMQQLNATPDRPLEEWDLDGKPKAFALQKSGSELNDVTFAGARETLRDAMSDLEAFRVESSDQQARLASMGIDVPSFELELDNEYQPTPDELVEGEAADASLLADWSLLAPSVDLDEPAVGGDGYWTRIDAQKNIAAGLKTALKEAYGR